MARASQRINLASLGVTIFCTASAIAADAITPDANLKQQQVIRERVADRSPASVFHVVVEPPFIVVGDEEKKVVGRRARDTVRWAVKLLKEDFFEHDPAPPVEIWLFRDQASYIRHASELFGERPHTPYGYYAERHNAILMNIATGGGTLVHEIVHPLMSANFPECPTWFNEGLGSLFEQSQERDGHIVGLTNWRLPLLQKAIHAGSLPSFETLLQTTERAFYEDDHGTNYAQARYLLLYVQERGLLRELYKSLRANHKDDPSGVATLRSLLNVDDLTAFQRDWQKWVLELRFSEERRSKATDQLRRRPGNPAGRPF